MSDLTFFAGIPLPHGATLKEDGINFSLFSRHGSSVILELFDCPEADTPYYSYTLDPKVNKTGNIWHVFVRGLEKNALYLYRVNGPFIPSEGLRFNVHNYLLDPYARALANFDAFTAAENVQTTPTHVDGDLSFSTKISAKNFPKCIATDISEFDWQGDRPLNYPLRDCIIYEAHVKGFSVHPNSPQEYKGTYKGIIESISYLKQLGITSLELLPIQEFNENENTRTNPRTGERLRNYWGYSTIAFFAPKANYAFNKIGSGPVNEFKEMVRELHKAGIEVILDIVFNHTAEGNQYGPTLSFKGLDNFIYYMLEDNPRYYRNYSGCGNTVNCNHPVVRSFIIHCLRYWVVEMHVDGFRFDLGSILGRDSKGSLLENPPMIERIAEDPILYHTKIIAEAWDAGGAYQVGTFPGSRWAEWNDKFRSEVRLFWRGDTPNAHRLATRVTGSSDLYLDDGRKPFHSVNYVTCHDGFTLYDLVSYNRKHNDENGEENKDGSDDNCSYNNGFEGPTENKAIESIRRKKAKNLMSTLLLSLGTPMFLMGDEVLRSQNGNNNAYCQDNEISWFDWDLVRENEGMLLFMQKLIHLRKMHPIFRRAEFLTGKGDENRKGPDISWYNAKGFPPNWEIPSQFLAYYLDGTKARTRAEYDDNDFYLMLNASSFDVTAVLPVPLRGRSWHRLIDTSYPDGEEFLSEKEDALIANQRRYVVLAQTIVVLIAK
ncbi:glycogen debranching enzyme GlgX [Treponema phagedenis]|uniref:Glycogen debranching protein GlgX n=1 Tax=Treponema phagedenis TaxID=162 RepID=A0A0B7GWI8_TREPH|nr:glycogen debranching protein GlgX [Treponema phagedenis]NVP23887.1 glycogen debranching protein GlgX [Treponema phagedenis]QEJ93763.1 glycogen debranching protein GlgX [Treponema phagedenis]QEJ96557.1 glycogen debranching protein GlgX [Treponema phagedenis]QEJ99724.1 glycogen debranching protein GlgX [Treponema phagedenis]QEK02344.1 glycogen debranching protein GlgX [Treponema phagedenis]